MSYDPDVGPMTAGPGDAAAVKEIARLRAALDAATRRAEEAERERDGFRNGQLQLQETNLALQDSVAAWAKDAKAAQACAQAAAQREAGLREALIRIRDESAERCEGCTSEPPCSYCVARSALSASETRGA